MKVSVIIPTYNEEKTIEEILKRVYKEDLIHEVIVVDDGSIDKTREILTGMKIPKNLKIVFHKKNKGKGAAIRTGLKTVSGEIVIIQDADLEYHPREYKKLIKPIVEGKSKVVYGTRMNVVKRGIYSNIWFYLGGLLLSKLANLLYGLSITDESTGYKVFETQALKSLRLKHDGFDFCSEVTAKLAKAGHKIYEVPISYKPRGFSEGKKIRSKDGLIAIWTLLKYRFFD